MRILIYLFLSCILLVSALWAQDPPASPVPQTEQWLTGFIDLGYRWQTGVGGSYETYRSVVNLGSGPKLLSTEFTIVDPKKRLFDRIDVRAYDWGDDPYATLHVNARKSKLYDLNVDYRNIAYFNNMPSYSDPLLSRGIILNEQSFDTHNHISSVELDLLPGHRFVPYLAFDRLSDTGTAVDTFVSNINEYPVQSNVRNSQNNYRGGVRLDLHRFHITLEQGGITYKDDQNVYQSPGSTNYGNNINPYRGETLYLTSLLQAYGIRGSSIYSKALISGNVTKWLDVYGQFLFSQADNSINYQQFNTGNFVISSQLLFYTSQQYLLGAEAKLPHTTGTAGADIRPFRKVRILESWLTDRLHNNSSAGASLQIPVTTAALLASSLVTNYNQEQVDVLYDPIAKLTLRGGYRYVWGDASGVTLPPAGLASMDRGALHRNVGIGGITYRPIAKLSLHSEIEVASSNGAYFRTSLYDYQKLRVRASYQATSSLQVAFDGSLLNNQNPVPGAGYDYLAHQESVSLLYSPASRKTWDYVVTYTRSSVRSDITYLDPGTLQPQQDLYRENGHEATALLNANWPTWAGMTARVSLGGSLVITSGSRPTSYFQPLARVSVPLTKKLSWVSEWRYYGYGETFYAYESFRTHLVTTGLRFTR